MPNADLENRCFDTFLGQGVYDLLAGYRALANKKNRGLMLCRINSNGFDSLYFAEHLLDLLAVCIVRD